MLNPTNHRRFRYEDVFRALGYYLDHNRFKDIIIMEAPEGFIIKGSGFLEGANSDLIRGLHTFLLTNEEIEALLEAAHARRRSAQTQHKPPERRGWLRR